MTSDALTDKNDRSAGERLVQVLDGGGLVVLRPLFVDVNVLQTRQRVLGPDGSGQRVAKTAVIIGQHCASMPFGEILGKRGVEGSRNASRRADEDGGTSSTTRRRREQRRLDWEPVIQRGNGQLGHCRRRWRAGSRHTGAPTGRFVRHSDADTLGGTAAGRVDTPL